MTSSPLRLVTRNSDPSSLVSGALPTKSSRSSPHPPVSTRLRLMICALQLVELQHPLLFNLIERILTHALGKHG